MRKINEIFYSIQGEGCHTGIPSVFIRFSGCNLRCSFCDTDFSDGIEMTDEEIIREVKKYPAAQLILTGGEPSLFIDKEFIDLLKKETGLSICIETNGTRKLPEGIDWITISPKTGMSDKGDPAIKVKRADELKVVDIGQDLEPYFDYPCVDENTVMLLQPCFTENEEERKANTLRTVGRVLEDSRWRLSLQTHRFIGIR